VVRIGLKLPDQKRAGGARGFLKRGLKKRAGTCRGEKRVGATSAADRISASARRRGFGGSGGGTGSPKFREKGKKNLRNRQQKSEVRSEEVSFLPDQFAQGLKKRIPRGRKLEGGQKI